MATLVLLGGSLFSYISSSYSFCDKGRPPEILAGPAQTIEHAPIPVHLHCEGQNRDTGDFEDYPERTRIPPLFFFSGTVFRFAEGSTLVNTYGGGANAHKPSPPPATLISNHTLVEGYISLEFLFLKKRIQRSNLYGASA